MYNRIEPSKKWSLLGCSAFLLAGCLDQSGGMMDTTSVQLTTGTVGSSGGEDDTTSTTFPPIMTTTQDPGDDSTTSATGPGTGSTGEPIPPKCGDGEIQADQGEECDDGDGNNADDAECTTYCKNAVCGDGLILKGVEQCDDKEANGQYDACNVSCSGLGPRCGDGVIQADEGELCDSTDPKSGCLKDTCQRAASCLELKTAWSDAAVSGSGYAIVRNGQDLTVYCDMDTDGGGYTFLKYSNANNVKIPAKDADTKCEQYGMRLFVPRSAGHLARAVEVAENAGVLPLGGGLDGDVSTYLRIMGIYPVVAGQSCPGMPLNSEDCAQWQAHDGKRYWVSGDKITDGQPAPVNCTECSMFYYWDSMTNALESIEAVSLGGVGADSPAFLCDPADKTE
jgi:hypothetical protein